MNTPTDDLTSQLEKAVVEAVVAVRSCPEFDPSLARLQIACTEAVDRLITHRAKIAPKADAELDVCPFCGCLAWMECHPELEKGALGYRVECRGRCHAMTCYWHTRAEAVTAWNQRVPAIKELSHKPKVSAAFSPETPPEQLTPKRVERRPFTTAEVAEILAEDPANEPATPSCRPPSEHEGESIGIAENEVLWLLPNVNASAADRYRATCFPDVVAAIAKKNRRIHELEEILNRPSIADFVAGVMVEAAHQKERWGSDHDAGKTAADWFWLIGYLAQKAMMAQIGGNTEKALHHTISTAAALANWHAAISGNDNSMRPGIDAVELGYEEADSPVAKPSPVEPQTVARPSPEIEFDEGAEFEAAQRAARSIKAVDGIDHMPLRSTFVRGWLSRARKGFPAAPTQEGPTPTHFAENAKCSPPTDAEIDALIRHGWLGSWPDLPMVRRIIRAALTKWPVRSPAVEWDDNQIVNLWRKIPGTQFHIETCSCCGMRRPRESHGFLIQFARALLAGGSK